MIDKVELAKALMIKFPDFHQDVNVKSANYATLRPKGPEKQYLPYITSRIVHCIAHLMRYTAHYARRYV